MIEILTPWMPLAHFLAAILGRGLILAMGASALLPILKTCKASATTRNHFLRAALIALLALPALWFVPPLWKGDAGADGGVLGPLQSVAVGPLFLEAPPELVDRAAPPAGASKSIAVVRQGFLQNWGPIAVVIWVAGFLQVTARFSWGLLRVRLLERRCEPVDNPSWRASLAVTRLEMGIANDVVLKAGREVPVPFVVGLFRHRLIIPVTVIDGSREQERAMILRHELAHVKRRDALMRFLSRAALALHWPNPLAWSLERAGRVTEELAVDDTVLGGGAGPVAYAELLKRFAGRRFRVSSCPAMAQASTVEKRVQHILDPSLNRRPPGRFTKGIVFLGVGAICVALASVWAQDKSEPARSSDESASEWRTIPFLVDQEKWLKAAQFKGEPLTAQLFLQRAGFDLHLTEGGAAIYNPPSQVVVRLKNADIPLYKEFFDQFLPPDNSLRIYLETRHVIAPEIADPPPDGEAPPPGAYRLEGVFTAEQAKTFLDSLSGDKATRVVPAPSLVTRSGQRATIETGFPSLPNCVIDPVMGDDGVTVDLNVSFDEGKRKVGTSVTIWSGQTVVMRLGSEPGTRHLVFITATLIRPDGGGAVRAIPPPVGDPEAARLNVQTVVLDPGHGGEDAGVRTGDLIEKHLTLDLARRVRIALEEQGFAVILTRQKDEWIPVSRRVAVGNAVDNAVFISLHGNASKDPEEQGFETLYPRAGADSDAEGERKFSRQFAVEMQMALGAALGDVSRNRGIREAPFRALREATHPAVTVEAGFLSNPDDAALLRSESHLDKVAEAIASALTAFSRNAAP